jgi:probable HAF family extracellular repeat protein
MKKLINKGLAAAACATAILVGYGSAHAADYILTDLYTTALSLETSKGYVYTPASGVPENKAFGINDNGQVIGTFKGQFSGASRTHVLRWDVSTSTPTVIDSGYNGSGKTYGYGINNSGTMVGLVASGSAFRPSYFNPQSLISTTTYGGQLAQAYATAINDSGIVVGNTGEWQVGPYSATSAFIWTGSGAITRIPGATVGTYSGGTSGSITGSSAATAINKNGLVTGYSTTDTTSNIARAFVYDSTVGDASGFHLLGTLGGLATSTSQGNGINLGGDVAGSSTDANGIQHAFLYTKADGSMIDIGALLGAGKISQANAVNNSGTVVGQYNFGTDNSSPVYHAFVYSNGVATDLNDLIDPSLGFTLYNATGINSSGQIVGFGSVTVNVNGVDYKQDRAFALTPTPTPIPPTVLLFASGLSGMFFLRRRKPSKES